MCYLYAIVIYNIITAWHFQMMLKTLNKQVRNFTGSGNTPMVYPLQPVFEEMQTAAETKGDTRTLKMCMAILRAMRNRPDDNYVAYRKVSLFA